MLQQTQVAVVIPYFLRWMERYPNVEALASASIDEVIKLWEGLGYYSRARNLHEGAKKIVAEFHGYFPADEEQLRKIKGLGPYTIGAILSFAFHKKKAALDGNVIRVMTRYFQIEQDVGSPSTLKHLRELVEKLLPEDESWLVNEGLIELGATICQKKASCAKCPLQSGCKSHLQGTVEKFPVKAKKIQTTYLFRAVPVISSGNHYLIKRGSDGKVMQDLHEFPYFEIPDGGIDTEDLKNWVEQNYQLEVDYIKTLPEVSHSFTRYQVRLDPFTFSCKTKKDVEGYMWKTFDELHSLAFSSGHRRILQHLDLIYQKNQK